MLTTEADVPGETSKWKWITNLEVSNLSSASILVRGNTIFLSDSISTSTRMWSTRQSIKWLTRQTHWSFSLWNSVCLGAYALVNHFLFLSVFLAVVCRGQEKTARNRCPTEYSRTEENWIQLGSHFSLAGSYFSSPAHSYFPAFNRRRRTVSRNQISNSTYLVVSLVLLQKSG